MARSKRRLDTEHSPQAQQGQIRFLVFPGRD
jgi:hypothetical protein